MIREESILAKNEAPFVDEEFDMLSLVIDAALRGNDVAQEYPEFYKRMEARPDLQQAFADLLEMTMPDAANEPAPAVLPADLSFLHQDVASLPVIIRRALKQWQVSWHIVADYLNQQFAPSLAVYRSGVSLLDDASTILLHHEFQLGDAGWQATLEAVFVPDRPQQLGLFLFVAADEEEAPPMQALLQWGEYRETAVLDPYGCAHFPPLDLTAILDVAGAAIAADMRLDLQFA